MYHSAGSNGHKFYINTTGGVGSPNTVGTNCLSITTSATTVNSGSLTVNAGRISMTNGGYGYSHFSGSGVEVNTQANGNTDGGIGCYSNHNFNLYANNTNRMSIYSNGQVNIGLSTSTQLGQNVYPLYIWSWCASIETASPAEKISTSSGGSNWNSTQKRLEEE